MQYIILDLEWNNTYGRKVNGFINEIIEIGAVELDENLNVSDTFTRIIKSQIGKKLRSSFKKLANITNEDLNGGIPFTKAVSELGKWIGKGESTILTWGDGDIRVLIDNYRYLNGISVIPFLKYYADLQAVVQSVLKVPASRQIGLSAAAQNFGIDMEGYDTHRALGDSLLSAECLKKCYNPDEFGRFVRRCDEKFYEKLSFKAYTIGNINNPLIDKNELFYKCGQCDTVAEQLTDWRFSNQYFRALFRCDECGRDYKVGIRFRKYYDRLDIRKTASVAENTEKGDEGNVNPDNSESNGI